MVKGILLQNGFLGDIYRSKQGLGTQHYDAFLLYADEDAEFATEMIENLENKYKLKVLETY